MQESIRAKDYLSLAAKLESEEDHQVRLIKTLNTKYLKEYAELRLLYAVPNGGLRHFVVAGQLKAQGVKPGVPDLCLPVARGGYFGMYIELKKIGGKPTKEQKEWIELLDLQGYYAVAVSYTHLTLPTILRV